jgi:hypothetical protein
MGDEESRCNGPENIHLCQAPLTRSAQGMNCPQLFPFRAQFGVYSLVEEKRWFRGYARGGR